MSAAPKEWPRTLRLLAAMLGPDLDDATRALSREMREEDWTGLVHLACTRHRVAPVIAPHLDSLEAPPAAREAILRDQRLCTIETLRQTAALRELLAEFGDIGLNPVLLKGIPLAEDLYGAAGHRHARDIDLLVRPDDLEAAAGIMDRLGYRPAPVYRLRGKLVGTHALAEECYDLEFVGGRHHIPVEIHWRTSHYAGWPDFTGDAALVRQQDTEIGPVQVPTDPANLIYLTGHGSMHAWARLKWLADIGRLAARRGPEALAGDLALASEINAHVPLALGLRLAHRVMGSPLPESLHTPSRQIARLEAEMLDVIAAPEVAPGTWRYRLSANVTSLRLAEGSAQVLGVLRYAVWRRLRLGAAGLARQFGNRTAH